MWNQVGYGKAGDMESGSSRPLYPMIILESAELRWAFIIRKISSIVAIQLILTISVAAVSVSDHPIKKHPVNFILLGIFTVALAFAVGLTCAYTNGKVILESVIQTAVVVISLSFYTFWAAKRGHDFNFLGPFLFGAVMVLVLFAIIQMFFPLGRVSVMIYGCLASKIFCGYIIYDADNLIKRYTYDEYIWAAVALYIDITNLFLSMLTVFRAADS